MANKLLIILMIGLFLISSVSAVCTVTLNKEEYPNGDIATATMSCSEVDEKLDDYTLNWTNASGYVVEMDVGTTPAISNTQFFESYSIPSDYSTIHGSVLNATLSGGDTEGQDNATVSSAGTNDLIITPGGFSENRYIGLTAGVKFTVTDENSKKITNAQCRVHINDNDNLPIEISDSILTSINGDCQFKNLLEAKTFEEGTSYLATISCFCGSNITDSSCIDEDGLIVTNSVGTVSGVLTIKSWLNVNTVTDKSEYFMKNEIVICANVTNVEYESRIPLHINHQIRCSSGIDNPGDLDRTLIISDDDYFDARGINFNTTQMQCKRFIIPESRYLQGKSSECYASTNVWVLDSLHHEVMGYSTTSPVFNITSTELNINPDWQRTSEYNWNTIVNLSTDNYGDFSGVGIGNIDLKLNMLPQSLDSTEQYGTKSIQIEDFIITQYIKNITAKNSSGDDIDYNFEMLDDGSIEIELLNVDISSTGWINVTLEFNDFEERQADALEGIENKTGTFHLDVDCPTSGQIGNSMACIINAYVEDSQTVEKEVDFTCHISDGVFVYSSVNFNQMVTRTPVAVTQNFAIPSSFIDGTQYVLQCYGDYYNLGSRRDSFYDTFTASVSAVAGVGGGGILDEEEEEKPAPITGGIIDTDGDGDFDFEDIANIFDSRNYVAYFGLFAIIMGIIFLVAHKCRRSHKCHAPHKHRVMRDKTNYKKIFKIIGIILLVLVIACVIVIVGFYGWKYFSSMEIPTPTQVPVVQQAQETQTSSEQSAISYPLTTSYSIIQDPLFRGIILTGFIVLIIIILFKVFHIRGELKFGASPKFSEDKRAVKLQEKLNRMMLKRDIEKEKEKIKNSYKTKKMSAEEFSKALDRVESKI